MYFSGSETNFLASAEVILDAVIASQHKRTGQPDQLFRLYIERAFLVCIRIQVEETFEDQVIGREDFFVHATAIAVELVYKVHRYCQVFPTKMMQPNGIQRNDWFHGLVC